MLTKSNRAIKTLARNLWDEWINQTTTGWFTDIDSASGCKTLKSTLNHLGGAILKIDNGHSSQEGIAKSQSGDFWCCPEVMDAEIITF